jgi:hypothetical protein
MAALEAEGVEVLLAAVRGRGAARAPTLRSDAIVLLLAVADVNGSILDSRFSARIWTRMSAATTRGSERAGRGSQDADHIAAQNIRTPMLAFAHASDVDGRDHSAGHRKRPPCRETVDE